MARWLLFGLLFACAATAMLAPRVEAEDAASNRSHAVQYGAGDGPSSEGPLHRLLDAVQTPGQSNALAFDRLFEGARESATLRCRLHVDEGGEGGSFLLLATDEYGAQGPPPFLKDVVAPNLRRSFAVGIDVHNPPSQEMFTAWGNYQDLPQREVSLHWDGREVVKRVAPVEFRGSWANVEIVLEHVVGGAEATVRIANAPVYERYFLPGVEPYELRPAIAAATRMDATTRFDVADVEFVAGPPAAPRRPPLRVDVFRHVLTDNGKTAYVREVALPAREWAFGRVVMTIDIHDAGEAWDEWDRNGEVSLWDDDGNKWGIVPFITSYRTPCHWEVDVTHFRPWLQGKRKLEIAAGTNFYKNRGYLMSLSLQFHHGSPALEPYRVVPLWHGEARYGSSERPFADFFQTRTTPIDADARAARLFVATTGHSQVGEFTPARRTIAVAPDAQQLQAEVRFDNLLWRTDCYLNPNRPQFGTWQFSRAGWAPGDVVRPWWIDLTPSIAPGSTAVFRYIAHPYEFDAGAPAPPPAEVAQAQHVVRAYLILERAPDDLVPAPTLRIDSVTDDGHAAKAGIEAGDYLVSYDGKPTDTLDELQAALQGAQASAAEEVAVVLYRGSTRLVVLVPPGRLGIRLGL